MSLQTVSYACKSFLRSQSNKMPLTRAERSKSHRKNSKEILKDMLYLKRKIEFKRGKVDRKLLVQEQLQRWECRERVNWLAPHVKAMKYHTTV